MSSYQEHVARSEREYEAAYEKWRATLTPAERAQVATQGIARADSGVTYHPGPRSEAASDPSDWPSASYTPDVAAALDGLPGELIERFEVTPPQARALAKWHLASVADEAITYKAFLFQRVCAGFLTPGNVKLRAAGLAFAANLAVLFGLGTQRQVAEGMNVSRAALSKVVKWWQKALDLPASPHMKSAAACSAYSRAQKSEHWRTRKCTSKPITPR